MSHEKDSCPDCLLSLSLSGGCTVREGVEDVARDSLGLPIDTWTSLPSSNDRDRGGQDDQSQARDVPPQPIGELG